MRCRNRLAGKNAAHRLAVWKVFSGDHGFVPADLGAKIDVCELYVIEGWNPDDDERPIVARHVSTNRLVTLDKDSVLRALPADR
jgi:hypothetical protein